MQNRVMLLAAPILSAYCGRGAVLEHMSRVEATEAVAEAERHSIARPDVVFEVLRALIEGVNFSCEADRALAALGPLGHCRACCGSRTSRWGSTRGLP